MKRVIKNAIMFLALFFACFCITKLILDRTTLIESLNFFQELRKEDTQTLNHLKTLINAISAFFFANIVGLLKIYFDVKNNSTKRRSGISISINTVTCLRRSKRQDKLPEITLGDGNNFVYVITEVKNVGENIVSECYFNDVKLAVRQIGINESYIVSFRICRKENKEFKKFYKINLLFKDDKDIYYMRKILLKVDEKKQQADIITKGRQKRRKKK